ncbi:hypothetical protein [Sphingomonas sp. STIS6.2]|uniref:hypothetical protein n=1 Tax=Sphingomonas sp. STIS6.2 TaxID=1379700 RepID=UPI00131CF036|nr:hypothetical protein [Sphingomonas sp. STIS6.2]
MIQHTRDKQRRFVELLYKKTLSREINWATNEHKQIYAKIAGRLLYAYSQLNADGEDLITFVLFGSEDTVSDQFTDEDIKHDNIAPSSFENWYLLCAALLEIARRQASGADDALDAMIDELDDEVPF